MGTRTGVEANERTQDGNENGSGDGREREREGERERERELERGWKPVDEHKMRTGTAVGI